ncbi:hypothetical protein GQ53DRAFT_751145 [Thozetella sp. PMI_491]|nr:hypothetical protein GQ53DRAFT_751145 [Thozetella sp. PMI_491]
MRRLQRLRSSAPGFSCASPSASVSPSFASSAARLQRELHATASRKLPVRISTSNEQTWLARQQRAFSSSSLRQKDTAAASSPEEKNELRELEEPDELGVETDLPIPRQFERAPLLSEVTDPNYTPAQSGEGLEEVGGWAEFWERPNAWPESKSYFGFKPFDKVTNAAVLETITRRALVEALAVSEVAGKDSLAESWRIGGKADHDTSHVATALQAKIEVGADGSVKLTGNVSEISNNVVGEEDSAWEEPIPVEDAQKLVKSWDHSWKTASLTDPWLKFAVIKRIQQLSGQVIPDAKQININSISTLLSQLLRAEKPKKLAEELELKGSLESLPNVSTYSRRVTPIDKEKMVGRWKVITQELEKRGLPVIGASGHGEAVERKWAAGRA